MTDGDPWSAKQHHLKSEAKEDLQLSPGVKRLLNLKTLVQNDTFFYLILYWQPVSITVASGYKSQINMK